MDADRIVGGDTASQPIAYQISLRRYGNHRCGGTILDPKTVLSAAHCFDKSETASSFSVKAGFIKRGSLNGQVKFFLKVSDLMKYF